MKQQVRLRLARGTEGQLLVCPVQRVAGLEGDDFAPAPFCEEVAQFLRRMAVMREIEMNRSLDAAQRAAKINRPAMMQQPVDLGMAVVGGAEHQRSRNNFV